MADKPTRDLEAYRDFKPAEVTEEAFEEGLSVVARYLLFGTAWAGPAVNDKRFLKRIPIINDVPLICKADDCEFAKKCPILAQCETQAQKKVLVGTECRADRVFAVEMFASLVRELNISPDNTVDMITVASLVRHMILQRRINWRIAIDGMLEEVPSVVDQRTGNVYIRREAHPLLKESERLEKQISHLQSQLMASRKERMQFAKDIGRGYDALKQLFSSEIKARLDRLPALDEADEEEED